MQRKRPLIGLAVISVLLTLILPSYSLQLLTPFLNITTLSSAHASLIFLENGVPVEDLIILGGSTQIIESAQGDYTNSVVAVHDLTTGGFWWTQTTEVPTVEGGDYSADKPLLKQDLIFEKSFGVGTNKFQLIVSCFNDTANLTRQDGLPVPVSEHGFKMTYMLTDWIWQTDTRYTTIDLTINGLTSSFPEVSIDFPDPDGEDPFSFTATSAGNWSFKMSFERWTLFDGELDFVGQITPSFSTTTDYYTRNQRNVSITYPSRFISNIEYDPTGLISLLGTPPIASPDAPASPNTSKSKPKPLWIIGAVAGVLVVLVAAFLVVWFVPPVKAAVWPYSVKKY